MLHIVQDKRKVQCRKTGRWYNPDEEFNKLLKEKWVIDIMKRLKNR